MRGAMVVLLSGWRKIEIYVQCVKFSVDLQPQGRRMALRRRAIDMIAVEVEFLLACEELAAARDAARPDPARIERLRERVRAAQRALWAEEDE